MIEQGPSRFLRKFGITDRCIGCAEQFCVKVCQKEAISIHKLANGNHQAAIDFDRCDGDKYCYKYCPERAPVDLYDLAVNEGESSAEALCQANSQRLLLPVVNGKEGPSGRDCIRTHDCHIVGNRVIGDTAIVRLRRERTWDWSPGDHVVLSLTKVKDKRLPARSYSIAGGHQNEIELCVRNGSQTSRALTQAPIGTQLSVGNPHGGSKWMTSALSCRNLRLMATGTGIAPFMGLIRASQERDTFESVNLAWGVRSFDDLVYFEELQELAEKLSWLEVFMFLSSDRHEGCQHGRITDVLPKFLEASERHAYWLLCGNADMISTSTRKLVDSGVPRSFIRWESF